MQLINITLPQLRAATKVQIITAITHHLQAMTKREIIIWLLENVDRIAESPVHTYRADGQVETITETETDVETGAVVSTRIVMHTYYSNGDIDTITIVADGATKAIKHYQDGKQPEVKI